jgi:putative oxidoreductase
VVPTGLLIVRLVLGLIMAAHGAQKLFGWFNGPGLQGFAGGLERLGVRPGRPWAMIAAVVEFGGGLLVAAGLLTPIAALFLAGDLLVAILTVHITKGFWNSNGGYEYPLALIGGLVGLSLIGPGPLSIDERIPLRLPQPGSWLVIVILVLLGVIAAVAVPRMQAAGQAEGAAKRPNQ